MSVQSAPYLHDEAAAYAELEATLWPNGPVCPRCAGMTRMLPLPAEDRQITIEFAASDEIPEPTDEAKLEVPQKDRFIETACALGADEDEAAFKAKLAVIARQKPKLPLKRKSDG